MLYPLVKLARGEQIEHYRCADCMWRDSPFFSISVKLYRIACNMPICRSIRFTRIYGFIDILNHMGGKADVAEISSKEQLELTDIVPILETGQRVGFC